MWSNIRLNLIGGLLVLATVLSFKVYQNELEKQQVKNDLIELSKIKYGLFNVDEWKIILADIITKKIEQFNLDDSNREEMRKRISGFLQTTIHDLEQRYYDEKSKSLFGMLQGSVAVLTGTFGKIKEDIPVFTDQILDFLNEERNREAIRGYLIKKLNEYADKTFSKTDYSAVTTIERKYGLDQTELRNHITNQILVLDAKIIIWKISLLFVFLLTFSICIFSKKFSKFEYLLSTLICVTFLVIGILLPVIEIDARISSMVFTLLGESVTFENQVLYYKSKSILEVVRLLIAQNRVDLIAVGILVLSFSVLFPLSKLICSVIYLFDSRVRNNGFLKVVIFKTGKWSMADVMVVAIFMAFIGFDGIISEQLVQLESIAKNVELLTTNQSNLLFGFYSFLLFVILSLILSQKMQSENQS